MTQRAYFAAVAALLFAVAAVVVAVASFFAWCFFATFFVAAGVAELVDFAFGVAVVAAGVCASMAAAARVMVRTAVVMVFMVMSGSFSFLLLFLFFGSVLFSLPLIKTKPIINHP